MARAYVAVAASVVFALGALLQAAAYPLLYNENIGNCEIPAQGYHSHKTPSEDPAITFELTDASGAAVSEWAAGAVYTLAVGPYDTTKPTNAWIHTSGGTLAPADASTHSSAAACDAAVFSAATVTGAHTVAWTAPADDSVCVTVSTAQATGPAAGFAVGLVSLPGATAAPCAAPVLVLTPEDEVHEEGHDHDEGAHAEEEGAAHAEEEGAAEEGMAAEDTSGAVCARAVAGALAVAAGVLGML